VNQYMNYCRDNDGIVSLELCDAKGKNSLTEPFVAQLCDALQQISLDQSARVLVLFGLPEVFCAGAPKELLLRLVSGALAPADIVLAKAVLDLPIPVISAMEGHAVGGGLALGLCADLIVMSRESRYGCTFMNMGFTPGMGITRLLEHVLSPAMTHELLFTGELKRGRDFEGRSGINYILPREEVRQKANDLASRIAEKPRRALVLLKRTLSMSRRRAFEESRSIEALMHEVSFADPEVYRCIEENYVGTPTK
jgi:polyketide biosynthesis enoyl-CoA hydratase PksI